MPCTPPKRGIKIKTSVPVFSSEKINISQVPSLEGCRGGLLLISNITPVTQGLRIFIDRTEKRREWMKKSRPL
jgi:hypothetical protein